VSSRCSGGEHDSTGLRAKHKLITPLLRCASPKQLRLTANFLDDTAKRKGEPSAPLFAFSAWRQNYMPHKSLGIFGRLLSLMCAVVMRNLPVVVPTLRMLAMVPVMR
jgi:hypothetical protein